jgi:peptide deformylase
MRWNAAKRVDPAARHRYIRVMASSAPTASPAAAPSIPDGDAEVLPILIAPNPILKARARAVTPADADTVRALIPRMFTTMYRAPGIGLAAPQVGVRLRLTVVDLMPDDTRAPIVLVNPEVIAASTELATREEGCLSLPNQYADVTRPARVKVRYYDQTGARREIEADGLLAVCLQHEIDHLDGVLFVDHISALKRNMLMRKLAKEMRLKDA